LIVQSLMILDCLLESIYRNPRESIRMYIPMIPMQILFLIGCSNDSLGFLGEYGLYNLMFQVFFHLQYILLTVEDLTGSSHEKSRFPGFDYLWITLPFAVHHLVNAFPILMTFIPCTQKTLVTRVAIGIIVFGCLKLVYVVYSMLA